MGYGYALLSIFAAYTNAERERVMLNQQIKAVFLHTPAAREDGDIELGVQVVVALLKALVEGASFTAVSGCDVD